jgi:peptidoglycan/xylan/chitin deacetylase (PgdA/CDA1 family)
MTMTLPDGLYRWISIRNHNLPLVGLLTFGAPKMLVRTIYAGNRGKQLWGDKKACFTLSFDCDYPEDVEDIPSVLTMLGEHQLKASFAAVGHWVDQFPRQHAMVLEQGHELMNHTWSHPDNEILNPGRKFRWISAEEKMEEIVKCHDIVRKLYGVEMSGLRIPHFKHLFSEDIYPLLEQAGYTYSSSTWLTNTTSRGLPFMAPHGLVEFPLATCPLHPFTVFDTWHSLNAQRLSHRIMHRGPEDYLKLFEELIRIGKATGSYINIYMDPLDVKKIPGFRRMLEILSDPELLVVTYEDYLRMGLHVDGREAGAPSASVAALRRPNQPLTA